MFCIHDRRTMTSVLLFNDTMQRQWTMTLDRTCENER
jgi:hypothetical protein